MKLTTLTLLAGSLLLPSLFGQSLNFNFDKLIPLAKEHAAIDLTGDQVRTLISQTPKAKEKLGNMQEKLSGLESVHVRTFEFEREGAYSEADLAPIRANLKSPGWSRVVSVKEKKESVEVYLLTRDSKTAGIAVIAAEPTELTVVHIVGTIKLNDLQAVVNSKIEFDLAALQKGEPAK